MLLRGRGSAWVCYPSAIGPCVRRWIAEEKGATATEYSLIAGLMALAIVSGVAMLGDNLGGTFTDVAAEAGPTAASNSQGGSSQDAGSGGNAAGATTPATSAGVGTSGAASSGAGTAAGSGGAATSGSESNGTTGSGTAASDGSGGSTAASASGTSGGSASSDTTTGSSAGSTSTGTTSPSSTGGGTSSTGGATGAATSCPDGSTASFFPARGTLPWVMATTGSVRRWTRSACRRRHAQDRQGEQQDARANAGICSGRGKPGSASKPRRNRPSEAKVSRIEYGPTVNGGRVGIAAWLHSLGLERYEPVSRGNEIDAAVLPRLNHEDLKEPVEQLRGLLGITGPSISRPSTTPTPCTCSSAWQAAAPHFTMRRGPTTGIMPRTSPSRLRASEHRVVRWPKGLCIKVSHRPSATANGGASVMLLWGVTVFLVPSR